MLSPLLNSSYRHLFSAQILSLLGTGLATVALGLLAFDLAGANAGVVLGTALFIKMVAYVTVAPIVGGFVKRLPRRGFLVALDLVRAAIALFLPFVDQIWQIYLLVFLLQTASAAFTPTFQATIPSILREESEYTKALSLSRLAYDLESLLSPVLAAALLSVMSFHWLFAGTALGFLASASLVVTAGLKITRSLDEGESFRSRASRGLSIYLNTPRLRGLLAFNLAAAAGGAFVIVNTVVLVRARLGGSDSDVAVTLALFGAGSMLVALALPRLLKKLPDRSIMAAGAATITILLYAYGFLSLSFDFSWTAILLLWLLMGAGYSAVLTPVGRILTRSSREEDRPAVFAAQFALSHACWLITYPLAGYWGREVGLISTMILMGLIAWSGLGLGLFLWPAPIRWSAS
jgi:MFS family permease